MAQQWYVLNVINHEGKTLKISIFQDERSFQNTTILQLKRLILDQTLRGGEVGEVRLLFKGKQLVDNKTFGSYGIENHSTICDVPYIHGGGGYTREKYEEEKRRLEERQKELRQAELAFDIHRAYYRRIEENDRELVERREIECELRKWDEEKIFDIPNHTPIDITALMNVLCKEPGVQDKWKEIAIGLGVSSAGFRDLEDRYSCTVSLHNVLSKWRDNASWQYPFTWYTIIEVLKGPLVDNVRKASEVKKLAIGIID